MSSLPLSHHQILELVEPLTRRGRRVDLAASDRLKRRLLFKPDARSAPDSGVPPFASTLQLEAFERGGLRLTRSVVHPVGLVATLVADGSDLGAMADAIDAVEPSCHFSTGPGFVIARSHQLVSTDPGQAAARMRLDHAAAQIDGLTLQLTMPSSARLAGDIVLSAPTAAGLELPEDLMAVLGWDWARLVPARGGWNSKLRLPRREPQRSRHAEARFELATRHLAAALAELPGRFHERHAAARWVAAFRRAIPLLTAGALVLVAIGVARLLVGATPLVYMLIFDGMVGLLALGFCVQELPRFEIPPLPRRSAARSWWTSRPAAATVETHDEPGATAGTAGPTAA